MISEIVHDVHNSANVSMNEVCAIIAPGMALDGLLFAQEPLNVSLSADRCDGEIKLSCQFARLMESRVYGLIDSSRFSPLGFVIPKYAIAILSEGNAMRSVIKMRSCTILVVCHGASTKFNQKVLTGESASPCSQVSTPRNVEIDERGLPFSRWRKRSYQKKRF
jgi:hypothetical protein